LHTIRQAALVLAFSATAFGQTWIESYTKEAGAAGKSCGAKQYPDCRLHLLKLIELLDGRADIVYNLASVEAVLGNKDAALEWLSVYSKSGLNFADPSADPDFATVKDTPEFAAIQERMKKAFQPISNSKPFAVLPEKDLISEDIAYDPVTKRFFISSVRHHKILSLDANGKFSEFVPDGQPGIWAILALRVDPKQRVLWATTAAMPESVGFTPAIDGHSALLKYSLDKGALLQRYDLPNDTKHVLGDMTLSTTGDVYVSDSLGALYWVDHRHDKLESLIGKGAFRSPQTPALSRDERKLYVPDYSRGISIVNLATKQWKLLEHPKELSLGGIDGLYLYGKTLIAVQNGTGPPRIIRMTLHDSLDRVVRWDTMEVNSPELGAPTHGVVVGDKFYFIANSGWDHMANDGSVKPGATFESPAIRVSSLVP
jgi:sugar lactone lactonase YvrE